MEASPASQYHFTYTPRGSSDLEQGDLLSKTKDVAELLGEIHPHYRKSDYTHFLVLTQTCDLVRRQDSPCKAKYISIAAVRSLSLAVLREIEKHQNSFEKSAQVCSQSRRNLLDQFVRRVFNNNEPEYFYLEPEPAYGLTEQSCAFLRLSVAIRSEEHYQKLLDARTLSLNPIFQAKLGWLLGSMYSRVGTPDWAPDTIPEHAFTSKVKDLLDDIVPWVDVDQLKTAQRTLPTGSALSPSELQNHIKQVVVPKRKQMAIDAVLKVIATELAGQELDTDKLRSLLNNDPDFKSLFK